MKREKRSLFSNYGKKEKAELLLLGLLLPVVLLFALTGQKKEKELRTDRPQHGTKKQVLYLSVEDTQEKVILNIKARERTENEMEEAFDKTRQEIRAFLYPDEEERRVLTQSLFLPQAMETTGAFLDWDSSDPEILDNTGEVAREKVTEETEVLLKVRITIGEEKREEWFPVTVLPYSPEEEGYALSRAKEYLQNLETDTRQEASFVIPKEIEGVFIQTQKENPQLPLLVAGGLLMLPVVLVMAVRREREKQKKLRERELLESYPQFVTKLTLYIGAGLSLRSTWERMAAQYREKLQKNGKKEALYEEILILAGELKNGTPEAKAYETFGKRLVLRPYLKCTSLFIGQLEKGTGGLREKLELEVKLAWDQHRLLTEAKGEEAQTKLLFPMMGMLFLVFAIVMLPAFFQMGM